MILLLAVIVSVAVLSFTLMRRLNRRSVGGEERSNPELELYFTLKFDGAPVSILMKQLIRAAALFKESAEELENNLEALGLLYEDRMIGEEHWEKINEANRSHELERMCIESEANILRQGYGNDIFRDAGKIANVGGKKAKGSGDSSFYMKKREVLEAELMRRIGAKSQ